MGTHLRSYRDVQSDWGRLWVSLTQCFSNLLGTLLTMDIPRPTGKENLGWGQTFFVFFLRNDFFFTTTFKFIYLFVYGCVGSSFLCEGFL